MYSPSVIRHSSTSMHVQIHIHARTHTYTTPIPNEYTVAVAWQRGPHELLKNITHFSILVACPPLPPFVQWYALPALLMLCCPWQGIHQLQKSLCIHLWHSRRDAQEGAHVDTHARAHTHTHAPSVSSEAMCLAFVMRCATKKKSIKKYAKM